MVFLSIVLSQLVVHIIMCPIHQLLFLHTRRQFGISVDLTPRAALWQMQPLTWSPSMCLMARQELMRSTDIIFFTRHSTSPCPAHVGITNYFQAPFLTSIHLSLRLTSQELLSHWLVKKINRVFFLQWSRLHEAPSPFFLLQIYTSTFCSSH